MDRCPQHQTLDPNKSNIGRQDAAIKTCSTCKSCPTNSLSEQDRCTDRTAARSYGIQDDGSQNYGSQNYGSQNYGTQVHDVQNYDAQRFDTQGYDAQGFDTQGYDAQGFDTQGYDAQGYDTQDYNSDASAQKSRFCLATLIHQQIIERGNLLPLFALGVAAGILGAINLGAINGDWNSNFELFSLVPSLGSSLDLSGNHGLWLNHGAWLALALVALTVVAGKFAASRLASLRLTCLKLTTLKPATLKLTAFTSAMFRNCTPFQNGASIATASLPQAANSASIATASLPETANSDSIATASLPETANSDSIATASLPQAANSDSIATASLPQAANSASIATACLPQAANSDSIATAGLLETARPPNSKLGVLWLGTCLPILAVVASGIIAGILLLTIHLGDTPSDLLPDNRHRYSTIIDAEVLESSSVASSKAANSIVRIIAARELELHGTTPQIRFRHPGQPLATGEIIRTPITLRRPAPATLAGGYNSQLHARLNSHSATGHAWTPPVTLQKPTEDDNSIKFYIKKIQSAINRRITAHLDGASQGIAIALLTGERSKIDRSSKKAMQASGLAHLIAISGAHMMALAGTAFLLVRLLLGIIPHFALRHPIKLYAAAVGLVAAYGYFLISGGRFSTQRAFIMVAVFFIAIMLKRRAVSARNLYIAGLFILALAPGAITSAGFQMSFAAVTAILLVIEWLHSHRGRTRPHSSIAPFYIAERIFRYLTVIALITLAAGVATAPLSIFHFGTGATFGLLANLLAMPVFSLVTIPAGFLALILMPISLEAAPILIMGQSIDFILAVARRVSDLPFSQITTARPDPTLLLFAYLSLFIAILLVGKVRALFILGFFMLTAGAQLNYFAPDLLASQNMRTLGVRTLGVRSPSTSEYVFLGVGASQFEVKQWLQALGDKRSLSQLDHAAQGKCDSQGCSHRVSANHIVSLAFSDARLRELCRTEGVIVTNISKPNYECKAQLISSHAEFTKFSTRSFIAQQ